MKHTLETKYPNVQFDDITLKQILNALKETNIVHDTMDNKETKNTLEDDPFIIYNNDAEFLIAYYNEFDQNELTIIFKRLTEFQTIKCFVLSHFNDNTMKLHNGCILELREDF